MDNFGIPNEILGYWRAGYFGGRTEVRLRRCHVPVVHLDFKSEYPTVATLLHAEDLLKAEEIRVLDATDEVQDLLRRISLDDCFTTDWRHLNFIAQIEPMGEVVPVRGKYGDAWNIGLNPRTDLPRWYTGPDLVTDKLLTGIVPKVVKAYRLEPVGRQSLQKVLLGGYVPFDPMIDDMYSSLAQERVKVKRGLPPYDKLSKAEREGLAQSLKIVNNAGYGIHAELNEKRLPDKIEITVYGLETRTVKTDKIEVPGRYFAPYIAALITAGGRLLLAILERLVIDAGGCYVSCDTDSLMVVATEKGGEIVLDAAGADGQPIKQTVKALSWAEVKAIVERFGDQNPYDRDVVPGSILEIKETNFDKDGRQRELWCYGVSSKRYCLYVKGSEKEIVACADLIDTEREETADSDIAGIVDAKESGLKLFLPPMEGKGAGKRFVEEVWRCIIEDRPVGGEPWAQYPVVYEEHVSNAETWKAFSEANRGRSYNEQIKPGNFIMSVSLSKENEFYVPGFDKKRIRLMASKDNNHERWYEILWVNKYNPKEMYLLWNPNVPLPTYPRSGLPYLPAGYLIPKTIGEYVEDYRKHPERTFLGPDGEPCSYETRGWLSRMPVMSSETVMVGKEGTRVGKDTENEGRRWEDVHNVWGVAGDRLPDALDVLRNLPQKEVATALGVNERKVRNWLSGKTRPAEPQRVIAYAATRAAEVAARLGIEGGDPFENYRRAKKAMANTFATLTTVTASEDLKAVGFSGSEIAQLRAGAMVPNFQRVAAAMLKLDGARGVQ